MAHEESVVDKMVNATFIDPLYDGERYATEFLESFGLDVPKPDQDEYSLGDIAQIGVIVATMAGTYLVKNTLRLRFLVGWL